MSAATSHYGLWARRALLIAPAVLVALTAMLSLHEPLNRRLDACFIYREREAHAPTLIPLGDSALHNGAVYAVWAAMLVLAVLPAQRAKGLFSLAYTSLWFHSTYILLAALKAPLLDFNCGGRHVAYPNGISGHYCYFIFVSLTAPILARARLAANPSAPMPVLLTAATLLTLYGTGAIATLYRTFAHGYHSPRQILLGSALGIFSHTTLEHFYLGADDKSAPSVALALAVVSAKSISAFALYFSLWPLASAGPAVTTGHLYFHACIWALLLACAVFLPADTRLRKATCD